MAALIAMVAAVGAGGVVWFMGFDILWSVASVLAIGSVGSALASLPFEEEATWDTPGHEPPRGSRIAVATIEASLAACDRLARPEALRRVRAFLMGEREDRLERFAAVRRMRALLLAELHDRGIDAVDGSHDRAAAALFGPDAITILQPHTSEPVTSAAIARCLDAVERLGATTQTSS